MRQRLPALLAMALLAPAIKGKGKAPKPETPTLDPKLLPQPLEPRAERRARELRERRERRKSARQAAR